MHLYLLDTAVFSEEALSCLTERQSPERRSVLQKRQGVHLHVSACAEPLLRLVTGCDTPILWSGKPRFSSETGLHFSLSHSGSRLALLMSHTLCGVDIERVGTHIRQRERMAKRLFPAPAEQAYLANASDADGALLTLWVAKEAYIKYTGEGFSRPMSSFWVDPAKHRIHAENQTLPYFLLHTDSLLCTAVDGTGAEEARVTYVTQKDFPFL